jgi:biopolymer transport protein TolR
MSSNVHTGRRTRRHIAYKSAHGDQGGHVQSDINVTPLVDVCLVLLIIFMVVTPMITAGKPVKLPQLVDATQWKEADQIFVSVDNDGVWLNADQYRNRKDFVEALNKELKVVLGKAAAHAKAGPPLFVKGDVRTSFQKVRVVMEWINEANIEDIALVVDTKSGAAAGSNG